MDNIDESIHPEFRNAWVLASPVAVSDRLLELFPGKSHKAIANFVEPMMEISSETVRRYINGAPMSHMFLVAVSLLAGVRFEWLSTGRGAKTEALELRRLIDSQTSEQLIGELLSRAADDDITLLSSKAMKSAAGRANTDEKTDTQSDWVEIRVRSLSPRSKQSNPQHNPNGD